jgi:hypothetical protein
MSADLERLLRIGVKAVRSGNTAAARGLFRALAREYPHDPRVWLGLAGSASDRNEQRYALEQVLLLDPQNTSAHNGLARLNAALPPSVDLEPATLPPPPPEPHPVAAVAVNAPQPSEPVVEPADPGPDPAPQASPRDGHFPLLNQIALGVIGLLALLLLALLLWPRVAPQQQANPTAPPALLPTIIPSGPPTTAPASNLAPTNPPVATEPAASSVAQAPTLVATDEPTLTLPTTPAATPTPAMLSLGAVLERDGWRATLLRPDYALILDGAIGELQPNGRFVLALMAVSNGAAEPRTLPADLFNLTDSLQRRYAPLPNASSIYLATYGREYGDQTLEEPFAAQSGMLSIPLIFDVPPDADGLMLTLRGSGPGWPITGGDTSGAGP